MNSTANHVGRVCLVGAGPGDAKLITVRGLERLRAADVVVYDVLANPVLLAEAPPSAERINVGKRAKEHTLTQDETNDLLVRKAREGKFVVRLKGGDPYLFGRGAEEAAYLARHGVTCEVVPGITAGIAAPAAAGIPVTHRKLASTVTFVTGHEEPGKEQSAVNFAALAAMVAAGGTACFYMGVGRLEAIAQAFGRHGLSLETPVAVVQWGTLPRQRQVRSTLRSAADDVKAAGIGAPAIIVVGPVAAVDEPGLDYFTSRPLFGKRIIVTRTRQQASDLRLRLEELGAEVLEAPTIELAPPQNWADVDDAITHIADYDWLVLTSAHAVDALADRLAHLQLDARHLATLKIAVIGGATEAALTERLRLRADLVPMRFVGEALAEALMNEGPVAGKRFLLLRADIARPALPRLLTEAGAKVTELTVYETRVAAALPEPVVDALRQGTADWITFTSSSTASNMMQLLAKHQVALGDVKIASIGPITSETLRELNLAVDAEASTSNIEGLVDALAAAGRGTRERTR